LSRKLPLRNYETNQAALAGLVKYGRVRLWLSRVFEILLLPFITFGNWRNRAIQSEPKSILVVEYWNLGDFVMLTPFFKNLRLHYPQAHIALMGSPRTIPMVEGQGLVDEIIPVTVPWAQYMSRWKKYFSRHWMNLFRCLLQVRAKRFDLGFTARADIRESFFLWIGGVNRRVGYGFAHGGSLLTDVVEPDLSRPHYSDRWLHLLEHLGKPVLDRRPELRVGAEQRAFARRFLTEKGLDDRDVFVGFHAGARNEVRQWGNEKFLEVARRLTESFRVKILWFQDPGARENPTGKGLIPVTLPLKEFLAVLSECKLVVCNDTGPMHMASGLGVPIVAVFGPTQPEWFAPFGEDHKIVIRREVWCRPCFDYCIFDQPYCLRLITVDSVYNAAAAALGAISGSTELLEKMRGGKCGDLEPISSEDRAAD
jgi:ADP-heptose:LPS heptosyltransferase